MIEECGVGGSAKCTIEVDDEDGASTQCYTDYTHSLHVSFRFLFISTVRFCLVS